MARSRKYRDKEFVVLRHATTTVEDDGAFNPNIPMDCVPTDCSHEPHPSGARVQPDPTYMGERLFSYHEFALDTRCHPNFKTEEWRV
ncbi:hypothetical protein E4U41_000343 [Claviceps citrina]|nr:hypothetical protein E4U41_000343 [Claviceps citrina]